MVGCLGHQVIMVAQHTQTNTDYLQGGGTARRLPAGWLWRALHAECSYILGGALSKGHLVLHAYGLGPNTLHPDCMSKPAVHHVTAHLAAVCDSTDSGDTSTIVTASVGGQSGCFPSACNTGWHVMSTACTAGSCP